MRIYISILLSLFISVSICQTDLRTNMQYISIYANSELQLAEYMENSRIETMQEVNAYKTIDSIDNSGLPLYDSVSYFEKNKLYKYDNSVVHCIQSHSKTIYNPMDIPALFSFYRVNSDTLSWIINEKVLVGWKRMYQGTSYTVLQEHLTLANWTPTLTLGTLWQATVIEVDCNTATEWLASDSWTIYAVGMRRTNNGSLWEVTSVSYTYYEPSGTYGYLSWTKIQDCE